MGYYSDVAITLTGEAQEVKDLLNAYRLTETTEQIEQAWHLLGDYASGVSFFYEEIDSNEPVVQMTWLFSGIKWYDESVRALDRLGEMLEEMQTGGDGYSSLALLFARMGEGTDDFEELHWGESPFDYESPVDVIRHFEVQAPAVKVNPIKQLFQIEGK
jgi:hypothetical protein